MRLLGIIGGSENYWYNGVFYNYLDARINIKKLVALHQRLAQLPLNKSFLCYKKKVS